MKAFKLLFILMFFSFTSIMAQNNPSAKVPLGSANKEKIDAMKIAFLTKELELTEEQAKTFWPIHNKYEEEKKALRKSIWGEVKKQDIVIGELSEEEAEKMINNYLLFKSKDLDLTKKYVAEFKKVLNTKQVAKLLVSEEKFKKMLMNQAKTMPKNPNTTAPK